MTWLRERIEEFGQTEALIVAGERASYHWLVGEIENWNRVLNEAGVSRGAVVCVIGDFTPTGVALLIELIDRNCIVVPMTPVTENQHDFFKEVAQVEHVVEFAAGKSKQVDDTGVVANHRLIRELRDQGGAGLVLFSSGSTGQPKGALHDFTRLLEKFKARRHAFRTIAFLLFDHIGGINTLMYTLSNGGTVISSPERTVDAVCKAIESHHVELLPTSPTFLNMLLISEAYKRFDLSSLKRITYGTELMAQATLNRLNKVLPGVKLQQTYGLSELGILRSKSRSDDSLWVKLGGDGFETRVESGTLRIKAQSAMRGYLNAPDPFSPDGWFDTGDRVEVDGEYVRFLGRESDIINVGGEKVFPIEVENVILSLENIEDASVYGQQNPLTGQMVVADVVVAEPEDLAALRTRVRRECAKVLERFKVPVKVNITETSRVSPRFKKLRRKNDN